MVRDALGMKPDWTLVLTAANTRSEVEAEITLVPCLTLTDGFANTAQNVRRAIESLGIGREETTDVHPLVDVDGYQTADVRRVVIGVCLAQLALPNVDLMKVVEAGRFFGSLIDVVEQRVAGVQKVSSLDV